MKKKVALIFIGNIEYCPYIREYRTILEKSGTDYNVLFWEREKLTQAYPENFHRFAYESELKKKKYKKVGDFIRYARWIKQELKLIKYTHYVFLDTLSGMLVYSTGCLRGKKKSFHS